MSPEIDARYAFAIDPTYGVVRAATPPTRRDPGADCRRLQSALGIVSRLRRGGPLRPDS